MNLWLVGGLLEGCCCVTFFPLDPANVMARGTGASLVREHGLQVIVATVVGTQVCRGESHVELGLGLQDSSI